MAFLVVVLLVGGCASSRSASDGAVPEAPQTGEPVEPAAPNGQDKPPGISVVLASQVRERQVIRNAEIDLDVKDLDVAQQAALDIIEEAGGYVSESSRTRRNVNEERAHLTFRVPAEQYDSIIPKLEKIGMVTDERTWANDVTEEYIDLTAAIENLQSQEERLRELMEQASQVEDVLRIENELTRVRQEIDSRTGRLRYLQDRVAYSTITLHLTENILANPTINATGMAGIGQRSRVAFVQAVNYMLQFTANLVVFLVGTIPVVVWLVLVGGIFWYVYRRVRPYLPRIRRGRSKRSAVSDKAE